ncbi:hypothetical protein GN958_ATG09985 [Phytophthora infestans]|uniref:Uncharacterized protein n=1 Tax=Phytophthora infestans TaxID=4787 RepID=A0A8S9UJV9_PHYIN|nr:hypothetical protein GN958_ATG09985 [Phytophthora infestans]
MKQIIPSYPITYDMLIKTSRYTYVQIYTRGVVNRSFSSETIRLPSTDEKLADVTQGIEAKLGFPGVAGTIDSTSILIKRFDDFERFYCRKEFKAVVDNELRFIAFSIRNGA